MSVRHPRKRPAFEPPVDPTTADPAMRRPGATIAGGVLVFLRAAAGMLWAAGVAYDLPSWLQPLARASGDDASSAQLTLSDFDATPGFFMGLLGIVAAVQVVFGILVLMGSNAARVTVMVISTSSIVVSFVGWWELGEDITVRTTFIALSLDILVLLALSSRGAAAYARRGRRRR